jgi:hypothetical protein
MFPAGNSRFSNYTRRFTQRRQIDNMVGGKEQIKTLQAMPGAYKSVPQNV